MSEASADGDADGADGLSLRERVTWIGHRGRRYWNPISAERVEAWADAMPLTAEDHLLDVGCGRGSLVLHAVTTHGCHGLGIDPLTPAIEQARKAAQAAGIAERAQFRCERYEDAALEPRSFRAVACLGASHAFDGWRGALEVLPRLLTADGMLLLGEGYWKRRPDEGYLDFLGCEEDVYLTHEQNQEHARAQGFEVLRAHEADDAEWVGYEDSHAANLHRFLAEHPEDPDFEAMLQRITSWRDAYLEWGVDTLGFGLYLLRRTD